MAGADLGEIRGIISLADKFSGPANDAAGAIGKVGQSFKAIGAFAGLVTGTIGAVGAAIVGLGQRGSHVIETRNSFNALSASIGQTGDVMLGSARAATQGLIGDMDLMAAANKAILLGLPVTSESLGTLAESAVVLGKAMGQDAKKSMDDLTTALGRSSPMILDNLGLSVKVGEANEEYAKSLGKSADKLTDAEKKQAFYNAAMKAAQEKVAALGGIHLTFADQVTIAKNQFGSLMDNVGVGIAQSPMLAAGFDAARQALGTAFGSNQGDLVKKLVGYVGDFAIGVTYVAQGGVIAGQVLVAAWYAVKVAIGAVLTVIASVGRAFVGLVSGFAEMGASIPLVGEKVKGFAEAAKGAEAFMGDLVKGLAAETAENAKAMMGHNAATETLTKVGVALFDVRDALEAAKGKQAETTEETKKFSAAQGEAATAAAAASDAIAAKQAELQMNLAIQNAMGTEQRLLQIQQGYDQEVAGLENLAGLTIEKRAELEALIRAKYQSQAEAAISSDSEVLKSAQALHAEVAVLGLTGLELELANIEQKRAAELAAIDEVGATNAGVYAQMTADVATKYQAMTAAAIDAKIATIDAALETGAQSREDAEKTARDAEELARRVASSAQSSEDQKVRAHETAEKAKREMTKITAQEEMDVALDAASQATGILKSLFGKSKAVAIAEVIINTARAVMQAFANYPPPASYVFAALAGVAGVAQIAKISSSNPGFRYGTPQTQFENFGRGTQTTLHGREAVVTERQAASVGSMLAGMVGDALGGGSGGGRGPFQINLVLPNGRKIAEALLPEMPGVLATYGLRG